MGLIALVLTVIISQFNCVGIHLIVSNCVIWIFYIHCLPDSEGHRDFHISFLTVGVSLSDQFPCTVWFYLCCNKSTKLNNNMTSSKSYTIVLTYSYYILLLLYWKLCCICGSTNNCKYFHCNIFIHTINNLRCMISSEHMTAKIYPRTRSSILYLLCMHSFKCNQTWCC